MRIRMVKKEKILAGPKVVHYADGTLEVEDNLGKILIGNGDAERVELKKAPPAPPAIETAEEKQDEKEEAVEPVHGRRGRPRRKE